MLKLENIKKTYNMGQINEYKLFSNFNLNISKGEFLTIIGSNGSGKSSLLNIVCGNTPIDSGIIKLNNKIISKDKEYQRAKYIGRVFQNPSLGTCPSMTILENIAMADNKSKKFDLGIGVNKKRINHYKEIVKKLKLGLEDNMHIKVGSLSGGQRQALALLVSTLTELDLLILDEHTAALDPNASENIMEITNQIVTENKVTTIMVTHNLKQALKYGTRIAMMHKGEIILDKSNDEKRNLEMNTILSLFNEISIELGN